MEETNYCVYKHISPSGKVYIGITSQSANKRWQNGKGYKRNPHFWYAIQKYGWENFNHEVLESGLSRESACEKEKKYIKELHATDSRFGYNMTFGGDCGVKFTDEVKSCISQKLIEYYSNDFAREHSSLAHMGKKHSEETRKKMSETHKATMTDEVRKRMGDAHKGIKYSNRVGHKQSEETKQKIRSAKIGKHYGGNGKKPRPVLCVDTGIVYESAAVAARKNGCGFGSIYNACSGLAKKANGFSWQYADEYNSSRETA